MAAICRSTIIKEGTPFTSEWSLRSLRNSHAVYVGIYIPFISEWLRRSAGICNFTVTTQVEISDQFFGWVLGFGKKAKILEPPAVVDQFAAYLDKVREMYGSR